MLTYAMDKSHYARPILIGNDEDMMVPVASIISEPVLAKQPKQCTNGTHTFCYGLYPVFDVIPHSFFEPMSYRIGVK